MRPRLKADRTSQALEEMFGVPTPPRRRPKPLDTLIATLLSQSTSDTNSYRAYSELRERFPTWQGVLAAPRRAISSAIRAGGLANQKSARIKQILRRLMDEEGDLEMRSLRRRPSDEIIERLTSFSGIGTKTAACVLLFSLGREVFPVDTHVHRICNRLGLAPESKSPEETFRKMQGIVPRGKSYSFHINLIQFGRTVCRAQKPLCAFCPVFRLCTFKQKVSFRKSHPHFSRTGGKNLLLLREIT